MQARDGENVDGAGDEEVVCILPGQRLAAAEQERRGQRRPRRRHVVVEDTHAPGANPVDPRADRPPRGRGQGADAGHRVDPDDGQAAARAGPEPEVELARVQRRRGPQAASEDTHSAADVHNRRIPVDDHGGPPGCVPPAAAVAKPLHGEDELARRADGRRLPRIGHGGGEGPRCLDDDAHHSHRDRHGRRVGGKLPGQIVGRKKIESGRRPGCGRAHDRGSEAQRSGPRAAVPQAAGPEGKRCHGTKPPTDHEARNRPASVHNSRPVTFRHRGQDAGQHAAGGDAGGDEDERSARKRLGPDVATGQSPPVADGCHHPGFSFGHSLRNVTFGSDPVVPCRRRCR